MFFSNIFNTKMKFENQIIGHPKGETADKRLCPDAKRLYVCYFFLMNPY